RWEWRGPGGEHMVMHGVNREIVPPERGVRTEIFEMGCIPQTQSQEQLATLVLKELGGTAPGRKTLLNITVEYSSKEARDGMIASGMEHGMAAGYDRLDEILATMV
ncbi:MAG: SRPBCC domain-containing protein, partial [Pyrinomonadaceae bacterium]|nr:SRPBCC domain-containing protein [Phycisphaerales bacterium]